MINLDTTTALIRLVTSGTPDIDVHVSYVERVLTTDDDTPDSQHTKITTAATTTILGSPATSDIRRNAKLIVVANIHATTANTVTVEITDGTTVVRLAKATLQAGEILVINDAGTIFVYDTNMGVKMGASAASDTLAGLIAVATSGDMEGATSTILAVTPGRQHSHPSACKAWLVAGVTGNILASYNITSLTDTGTGVLTITIATDFSSVDYACVVQVEATATTWAVANARETHVRSATRAVGSIAVDCIDNTATTNLVKDPSTWHVAMFGDQ